MDSPSSPSEFSCPSEHNLPTTWTDEETGDEGTGEETFREEDPAPTDAELLAELVLDASIHWEGKDVDLVVGDGDSGKKSYAETARMFQLRRNLDQLDCFHRQKEHNVLKAREELRVCRLNIAKLEKQRDAVEEEMEQQKDNSASLLRLRAKHKRLCGQLLGEEEIESHVSATLREHELKLCQVEVELGRFSLLRQEVQEEEQQHEALQAQRGAARLHQEASAARGLQLSTQRLNMRQAAMQREEEALCQRATEQAQAGRQKAAVYLKQTVTRMRQQAAHASWQAAEAAEEQQGREQRQKQMQAVLSLKANIAATQESLQVQQTRAKAQAQKQGQEERQLRESLQAQGVNSTKHMHQQSKLQDFHRKKEEFEDKQKSKRVEIVSKLMLEEDLLERRKRHRALLFPPTPVGLERAAGQERSREKVLRSLDPSEPEKKTKRERPTSVLSDSSSSSDVSDQDSLGEARELEEEQGLTESLAQPEFTGLWAQTHQSSPGGEAVSKALEKQDMALLPVGKLVTAPNKVLQGKEFKGPPFISKPEVVLFKDFEVGETYKKKVVLTNVSYTTNYCKLLGVRRDLKDFISISFQPPGPMSPGMACDMQVIFQPLINKGLEGEVQFASAAGPFAVPLRCTVRQCDLAVDSSIIDFGTHVVGQTISQAFTLTNRGALGTRFTLVPSTWPSPAPPQPPGLSPASSASSKPPQESSSSAAASAGEESPASRHSGDLQSDRESQEPPLGSEGSGVHTPAALEPPGPEAASGDLPDGQGEGHALQADTEDASESCDISMGEVREGEVGPFESVTLEVVFTPTIPGEAQMDFLIKFTDPACEPIPIRVHGMALCVPVWVTQPNMDLKICMFDRLYQDSIVVQSRASTALQLTFQVSPELRNHMEVLPKTGFIQARSSFNAQLKFLPRRSLSQDATFCFDSETGVLEVPLTLQVADQVRPIPFMVHAVVTSSDLRFDRTEVDFGCCSVYESVRTSVRLTNLSLLPQVFGFVGIPQFMEVQPNEGFGVLLPLETLEMDLIFSAKKAGEYSFLLNCRSGINRDFPLTCRAVGVHPALELSHSLVEFGATAVGDRSTAVLHVVNPPAGQSRSPHPPAPRVGWEPRAPVGPRLFAFAPPENAEITIIPMSGRVLPGQRTQVQVTFRPRLGDQEVREEAVRLLCRGEELRVLELERPRAAAEAEAARHSQSGGPSKKEAPADGRRGKKQPSARPQGKQAVKEKNSKVSLSPKTHSPFSPPNPADIQAGSEEYAAARASLLRSFSQRYGRYIVPCFLSDGDPALDDPQVEPAYSPLNTLYLELHCPAVRPALVVTSSHSQTAVSFNQVAVGETVVKKVTLQNISQEHQDMRTSVLDLSASFSLLNAPRRLGPGDTHTLLLAFRPALGKKYRETLEIHGSEMTLALTLQGEGVVPSVTCSLQGRLLDMGYLLEKDSASQVFKLQNTSSLAVRFSVLLASLSLSKGQRGAAPPLSPDPEGQTWPIVGTQNYSGLSVFSVSPGGGAIPPGKSQDITVTFQPDHQSLHYFDRLTVELMNKTSVCVMELRGAACSHTMYLCGGDPLAVPTESLLPLPTTGDSELTESEKPPQPVLLTLRAVYREGAMSPGVRELEVGCIRSTQPMAKKNGEFSWDNLQELQQRGFTVEPSKGTVDAGHRRTITVTWTPSSGLKPNEVVQVCAPLTLRGDETEVYSVTLLALVSRHDFTH